MKMNLISCFAFILIGGSTVVFAASEATPPSTVPLLVETDSTNATHMLQLLWQNQPTNGVFRENLFWFKEKRPMQCKTNILEDNTVVVTCWSEGAHHGTART